MGTISDVGTELSSGAVRRARSAFARARRARAGMPTMRARLVVFTLVCSAFALVILSALLLSYAEQDREDLRRQIEKQAAAITQSIESEIAVTEAILRGLATSPALVSGDLPAFYSQAKAVTLAPGSRILLYDFDAGGRRRALLNTALTFGSPQPPLRVPESDGLVEKFLKDVVATRHRQVSDVVVSSLDGQKITAVGIPIIQNDGVRYVLVGVLPAIDSAPIFGPHGLPPKWFSAVVDRGTHYVTDNRAPDGAANLPVLDETFSRAVAEGKTVIEARAGDGRALYVAVSRSNETGWLSIVAVPQQILEVALYRALLIVGIVAGTLLLATLGLAIIGEPRVARPLLRRLTEDEERFRVMADTVPSILFTTDSEGRCDYVSDAFYAYTGMPAGSAEGFGWSDALHPEDRESILKILRRPLAANAATDGEARPYLQSPDAQSPLVHPADTTIRLRGKDGSYRWFLIRTHVASDADGRPVKRFGTVTDIDDLKQSERALRESEHAIRRVSTQLMKTQDDERQRIAREIHDSTLQDLAAATMQVDLLRTSVTAGEAATEALDDIRAMLIRSQQDLRTLSYLLHPPMLDELGLSAAIKWYARGFEKRSGIRVTVTAPDEFPRLPNDVETALFRVVQEGLSNVRRHSGSSEAWILLEHLPQSITLEITDRGKGMGIPAEAFGASDKVTLGVGIPGMRLRLQQIGGTMEILAGPGGTTLRAGVPSNGRISRVA